ncbi:MAG: diguanylate cyclase [Rhizobiaceae bacterium]
MRPANEPETGPAGDLLQLAKAIGRIGGVVDGMRDRMRLLEAVIENFPGGISLFDESMNMVLCNRQQKIMLDYPDELFAGGNPSLETLVRFNAQRGEYGFGDVEEQVAEIMAVVAGGDSRVFDRPRPNGRILEVRCVPVEGGGCITTYFDVTEQRRTQAMIAHLALHDALTDLPNRKLFDDRLQTAIAAAKGKGLMALHYIDVDNFKPVNDQLGHRAGDTLLVSLAERLRGIVRHVDTVARIGGDEFAIVQTGLRRPNDAAVLARRILGEFGKPFSVGSEDVKVGVSIGIALAPKDGVSAHDMQVKADNALYRSKSSGRGRFSFFEAA